MNSIILNTFGNILPNSIKQQVNADYESYNQKQDFIANQTAINDERYGGNLDGIPYGSSSSADKWTLSFTGQARDVTYINEKGKMVTRQIGEGKLSILDSDGNTVASFDAISGPGTNGLLPNGDYNATDLTMEGGFADEKGLSYKLFLKKKHLWLKGLNELN